MKNRTRTAGTVAGVAAAATLLLATVAPAGAAVQDAYYVLTTGQVTIGATNYPLPAATGISGTWDDVTGDFDGTFLSEAVAEQQTIAAPVAGTIDLTYQFFATTTVTGNIDPGTGDGTLDTTMDVIVTFQQITLDADPGNPLALGQVCTIADVPMSFTASASGGPAPIFDTLSLTASGFAAPAATCAGGDNPALTPVLQNELNSSIGLPTTETSANLRLEAGQIPPASTTTTTAAPTTTTTAPTTTTSVAPVAVTAQPTFTG